MRKVFGVAVVLALATSAAAQPQLPNPQSVLVARAKSLELKTPYVPPPGDALETTLIVSSHDLVVVRLGHFKGATAGGTSLRKALALLMQAVPSSH